MINFKINKKFTGMMIPGLVILAVVMMMAGPALGATYHLRARQFNMEMPDSVSVAMWGYALWRYDLGDGNGWVRGDRVTKVPGPKLMVPQGQNLRVILDNRLEVPVSITIPGQMENSPTVVRNADGRIRSFTRETPPNGRRNYRWNNLKPGTYLYHSGTHPAVQVQMGLYGGMSMNSAEPAEAYPGVPYDKEVMVIYSEIDPALHQAVADGIYGTDAYSSTIDYYPKYFLVNGAADDPTGPLTTINADDTVLLRILNAGLKDHAPQILGSHVSIVAEDGNLYPYPRQQSSLLLPPGKTLDSVFSPSDGGKYTIFDRRAFRTNAGTVEGAMSSYISVNE